MSKSNCQGSFADGVEQRRKYPLREGRYKLQELQNELSRNQATLRMVRGFVSGMSKGTYFGECTAADKHTWLKKLPLEVAFSLSYDLLAGLKALKNEGANSVDSEYTHFERECLLLVGRLERVRSIIAKDINVEYRHMKQGESLFEPLLAEAIEIAQRALEVS